MVNKDEIAIISFLYTRLAGNALQQTTAIYGKKLPFLSKFNPILSLKQQQPHI